MLTLWTRTMSRVCPILPERRCCCVQTRCLVSQEKYEHFNVNYMPVANAPASSNHQKHNLAFSYSATNSMCNHVLSKNMVHMNLSLGYSTELIRNFLPWHGTEGRAFSCYNPTNCHWVINTITFPRESSSFVRIGTQIHEHYVLNPWYQQLVQQMWRKCSQWQIVQLEVTHRHCYFHLFELILRSGRKLCHFPQSTI